MRQWTKRLLIGLSSFLVLAVAGATWRALQRDQATLSERGCQIIAEQSGHLVPIDQPQIVVDAVRMVVDGTRSGNAPVCGGVAR